MYLDGNIRMRASGGGLRLWLALVTGEGSPNEATGVVSVTASRPSTGRYSYPGHADYDMCYRLGAPCPLGHAVCDAAYCSVTRFAAIADALRAASPYVQVRAGTANSCGVPTRIFRRFYPT